MSYVCGSAGIAQRAGQSYKCEYSYQIFEPDGEWQRKHKDFLVAKQHGGGHENCIDSARGTNRWSLWAKVDDGAERVSQSHSAQTSPNDAEQKKLQEAPAAPGNFKHGAKHPQHQHVEEHVKKTSVHEPIRQQLINMSMDNVMRTEGQRIEDSIGKTSLAYCNEYQPKKVNTAVDRDQYFDGARKRRE